MRKEQEMLEKVVPKTTTKILVQRKSNLESIQEVLPSEEIESAKFPLDTQHDQTSNKINLGNGENIPKVKKTWGKYLWDQVKTMKDKEKKVKSMVLISNLNFLEDLDFDLE